MLTIKSSSNFYYIGPHGKALVVRLVVGRTLVQKIAKQLEIGRMPAWLKT